MKKSARRSENPHSLKRKTWHFFLAVLSIFFVVLITSYTVTVFRAAVDNEVSGSRIAMTGINKNISSILTRYTEMSRLIMINSDVVDFLHGSGSNMVYNASKARSGIISITHIYTHVDTVYIFRADGEYIDTGGGITIVDRALIETPEWYGPLEEAKGAAIISINGAGAFKRKTAVPVITIARYIYDIDTLKPEGILVVNLSTGILDTATKDIGESGRLICFFDTEGNVLWGDKSLKDSFSGDYIGKGFVSKELTVGTRKQILSAYSAGGLPIVQLSISDVVITGLGSWEAIWIAIILLAAVVLSVFGSGAFVSMNIAKPIDMLTGAIDSTKSNGELHEIKLALPNNEIRRLADSYNNMIAHINRLITELIEKEKSVRKAEMRTLQEQIKPHFLYNSLESISCMALQGGAPKVHDALETLGSFYRNFLSKGSRDIPLRSEILIVKDYLALQKLRYGDAFEDEYNIDENVMDIMLPKLILQPLVENSLYHGVRLKGEKGIIRISAYEKDEAVHITVYDTGVGMEQEQIDQILLGAEGYEDALSGFGLSGTIERIRYYCNCRDVVKIRSAIGEYTEIELIIPKQK